MAFPIASSLRSNRQRLWNSDRMATLRFYGRYFRGPLLLVLLALAAEKLLFYGGLPLEGYVKREWDYAQAERAYATGHDQAALVAVRRALLETRSDPRFWLLAARISDRLGSPEAAYCWEEVDRLEPGSPDIELALTEAALKQGQPELARAALHEVAYADQASVRYALDAGRLSLAESQGERAQYWFTQVEAARPADARTLFVLADWHSQLATAADQGRARTILLGLAARPTARLAAWRALVALDLREHDDRRVRTDDEALLATAGAAFSDRLQALNIGDAAQVDSSLSALLKAPSPAEAAQVLDWMTAHSRAEPALIWIRSQEESWQDDPVVGAARAHCLAMLGDWEHLRDDQLAGSWPGHESARLMWLARTSLELGNVSDARAAWNQAIAACATPADFTALLDAVDSFPATSDRDEEKAEVWMALANRFPGQVWPLRALLAYQMGRGDLVASQTLAARLVALAPGDATLAANADLIFLLREGDNASIAADLKRLVEAVPENPAVATAAAYSLYLQGRFDDALATLGALDSSELRAPERAAYLGQLLAAAGPIDRAQAALELALAQPDLLEGQRAGIARALNLVAYRREMADWRHGAEATTRDRARDFFVTQAASGQTVGLIGESVVLAVDSDRAAEALARVDPAGLNEAELRLYEGAVLNLAGQTRAALPLLELAEGTPVETAGARWHRSVEAWWTLAQRGTFNAQTVAGLLTAYRGLETQKDSASFWRGDEAREMTLARAALERGELADAVKERLEALLRHVPATPELEAEVGYALFLQGRIESGRERLEVLSPAELARPEPALYYAAILRACGETKRAEQYAVLAGHQFAGRTSP
jgi:predicted Zn-dependent protease